MLNRIYEVVIRYTDSEGEEEEMQLFFQLFPSQKDVLDTLTYMEQEYINQGGNYTPLSWFNERIKLCRRIVSYPLGGWFEVGCCGGRPSSTEMNGYVELIDHTIVDNTGLTIKV